MVAVSSDLLLMFVGPGSRDYVIVAGAVGELRATGRVVSADDRSGPAEKITIATAIKYLYVTTTAVECSRDDNNDHRWMTLVVIYAVGVYVGQQTFRRSMPGE